MKVSGKVFIREQIRYLNLVSSGGARIELLSQKNGKSYTKIGSMTAIQKLEKEEKKDTFYRKLTAACQTKAKRKERTGIIGITSTIGSEIA